MANVTLVRDYADATLVRWSPHPAIHIVGLKKHYAAMLKGLGGIDDIPGHAKMMADGYIEQVAALLDKLDSGRSPTASALFRVVDRVAGPRFSPKLTIWPREDKAQRIKDGSSDWAEIFSNALNASGEARTNPAATMMADASKDVRGPGEDMALRFDPADFDRDGGIRQLAEAALPEKYTGVGMDPEFVLFHEMVHCMRGMRGLIDTSSVANPDYVNFEEFAAVLITNIVMSEFDPRAPLRYGEKGFKQMPKGTATSAGYLADGENTDLVRRLYRQDVFFMDAVKHSTATGGFNPVREYYSIKTPNPAPRR